MRSEFAGSGMPPMLEAVRAQEVRFNGRRVVRIMAVDPGVITGVSVFWICADTGDILAWAETLITFDELLQVFELIILLRTLANAGMVHVVIEDFRVSEINMSTSFLSPVRIGRQFEFAVFLLQRHELGEPIFGQIGSCVFQDRSRKADFADARLMKLGFHTPGPDHRRDATRHALVRRKQLKLELPLLIPANNHSNWEPGEGRKPEPKITSRTFNGVSQGSHLGSRGKIGVSKSDLERMKRQRSLTPILPKTEPKRPKRRKLL